MAQTTETGWRDIASAPKDGTRVDLWMVNEAGYQWREPDAYFVRDYRHETCAGWDAATRRRRCVMVTRDGWWAPNHDYDGADGPCEVPRFFNDHPAQNKWMFSEPTHWMPLPEPPK